MLLIRRNGHAVPDVFNRLYYTTLQVQIQEIWDKFQQIVYSIFIGWAAQKKRQLQKLSLLYVLAPLVAVGGVLQQNVMGAARSPRAGDARGPRIGLKWAGEARPFQGFAPQIAWTRKIGRAHV